MPNVPDDRPLVYKWPMGSWWTVEIPGRVVAWRSTMKTAKDDVRELLEGLPDDASLEDIQYHIYVRQKVQKGLEAAREGRTLTHEEVTRRMSRWLEK
jgi:hypothetical protein